MGIDLWSLFSPQIAQEVVPSGVGIEEGKHPHQTAHHNTIPVVDFEGVNKIERLKRPEALRCALCETAKGTISKVYFPEF